MNTENGSSFKGRKRLFKTLSLFSSNSPTSTEPEHFDFENESTSTNLLKCQVQRNDNDVIQSSRKTNCKHIQENQDTKEEIIHCSRYE